MLSDHQQLKRDAALCGVPLDEQQLQQLLNYAELVLKWQRITNLTGARTRRQFLHEHVLDCLAVMPYIDAERVLDVGSGAGLPGVVFAIVSPQLKVSLLEPRQKRVRFLRQVNTELGLSNEILAQRIEHVETDRYWDVAISRALGSINEFVASVGGCARRLLLMKAELDADDLRAAERIAGSASIVRLEVPGREQRHLVQFSAKHN